MKQIQPDGLSRFTPTILKVFLVTLSMVLVSPTSWAQEAAPAQSKVQEEIQQLQRDYIDLQKTLLQSGVSPAMKDELEKLKQLDELKAELEKLRQETGTLKEELAARPEPGQDAASKAGQSWLGNTLVWVVISAVLVMLMQAGFAFLETGLTRAKNAAHTMSMNLLDYALGMLAFWAVGFAIMFGNFGANEALGITEGLDKGLEITVGGEAFSLMGLSGFFLIGPDMFAGGILALFLFQCVFANTANTIPTGTLAERWKLSGFYVHSILVAGFIYPLFGHWVWGGGWLGQLGYADFAGSTVVHMAGGVMALIGAVVVGPRAGKFNVDGSSNAIPGHNMPLAFLGTFLLAFGWFGFNAGSTLTGNDPQIGLIAVNTALASGAGAMAAALTSRAQFGKPDPTFCCNGLLGGLVGITAGCAFVDPWAAVLIGTMSGVLVVYSAIFVEEILHLDDPVGAISVHGSCGALGGIAVGFFANGKYGGVGSVITGDLTQLGVQSLGVITCFFTFGLLGYGMFWLSEKIVGNRATAAEQLEGLDASEMGTQAYAPDSFEEQ